MAAQLAPANQAAGPLPGLITHALTTLATMDTMKNASIGRFDKKSVIGSGSVIDHQQGLAGVQTTGIWADAGSAPTIRPGVSQIVTGRNAPSTNSSPFPAR